jgi:hypothetical protein
MTEIMFLKSRYKKTLSGMDRMKKFRKGLKKTRRFNVELDKPFRVSKV